MSRKSEPLNRPSGGRYHAYLLRLWQEKPAHPWRASLQEASTQQLQAFADLDQLIAFLRDLIDTSAAPHPGADSDK